jgi:two-component system, sensor histidine kinase and response regulator
MQHSGNALISIINDILDFSKIESGKLSLESVSFDLLDCIQGVGDILALRAQEAGLQFAVQIEKDVPERVTGDPGRLRQILINLLGNAIKFTDDGYVRLVVVNDQRKSTLRFSIDDTGRGIDGDSLPHLFDPFYQ